MENSLATELLRELKKESQRRFVLLIICLALLFVSNMAWLIAWNLPTEKVSTETYEMNGEDSANVFYNDEGEVKISGQNQSD